MSLRRWGMVAALAALVLAAFAWRSGEQTGNQTTGNQTGKEVAVPVSGSAATPAPAAQQVPDAGASSELDQARALSASAAAPRGRLPEVVTQIDGRPLHRVPIEQRLEHLPTLRRLADAGWAEAALALVPIAADCIDDPPQSVAQIRASHDPSRMVRMGEGVRQWVELSEAEREAERQQWDQRAERQIERDRQRRVECELATPDDPDRLMDWLEQALIQQPPDLFRMLIEDSPFPDDKPWLVRNAERIARFNHGLLAALRARIAEGDRLLLTSAWHYFAHGRFQAEPDAFSAAVYAHAASHLSGPESRRVSDLTHVRRNLGEKISDARFAEAAEVGAELYRRCCSGVQDR